ncbi:MAG: DNA adenine methylase [Pseudomonadota bacterium]
MTGYLASAVQELAGNGDAHYMEPYCGGAGAALGLLAQNAVSRVHINDGDIRVYSAWRAMLTENDRFIDELNSRPANIKTWHDCRDIVSQTPTGYSFELGFATFFINRTSRAGIVLGSGPIGGYAQDGNWKIDARYYPETISKRLKWLGQKAAQIELSNEDGIDFLKRKSNELSDEPALYLIDPPYVKAGGRLYLNAMDEQKHRALAKFLNEGMCGKWVLTYDDHPLVRELYQTCNMRLLHVNYSLKRTRKEAELMVEPHMLMAAETAYPAHSP